MICILPGTPWVSMRLAVLTASPQTLDAAASLLPRVTVAVDYDGRDQGIISAAAPSDAIKEVGAA